MEKFYLEIPTMKRKDDAIAYINEHYLYGSNINGSGSLNKYTDHYDLWLEKLERDYNYIPDEERVPSRTYFLIRENDDKIIGMINIRLTLNKKLSKFGGHIGYGIRPTERGNGYNKINLYLGLKVCNKFGIDKVFMDADLDNPASWRTMEALGGVRVNEYFDSENENCVVVDYNIDVNNSLKTYSEIYEQFVSNKNVKIR